jgi:phosphoribosylaminoimidazole-succinocarboxamide synthase
LSNKKIFYEQVGKKVYGSDADSQLIQEFTDEIRNPKDTKKIKIKNRGEMSASIAIKIFEFLESYHIPTMFISQYSEREILIRNNKSIPLEVVVRNYTDKEYSSRTGMEPGTKLEMPIIELYTIDDNDEQKEVTESDLVASSLLSVDEVRMVKRIITKLNALLIAYFNRRNLILIDYKVRFGKQKGQVLLISEIIPETCSLNDTGEKDLSNLSIQEKYLEIFNRLVG